MSEEQQAPVVDLFAGMKKKKKKKTAESPAASTRDVEQTITGETEDFAGLKKKKKKKAAFVEGAEDSVSEEQVNILDQVVESTAATVHPDEDFSNLVKKKKKKRIDAADFESQLKAQGFTQQIHESATETSNQSSSTTRDEAGHVTTVPTYPELLTRIFSILRANNPELGGGEKKKYTIVPPDVQREGSKKTAFANLVDICKRMHRQPDHVIQFLFSELGTSGSIDGNQRLVIKGRFQQKQIENVLKRYIVEYVTCKTCKSANTLLTKENRLFFLQCESCGSTRTVSAIKAGFQAQIGRRVRAA